MPARDNEAGKENKDGSEVKSEFVLRSAPLSKGESTKKNIPDREYQIPGPEVHWA